MFVTGLSHIFLRRDDFSSAISLACEGVTNS